jgi:hypothetical protein
VVTRQVALRLASQALLRVRPSSRRDHPLVSLQHAAGNRSARIALRAVSAAARTPLVQPTLRTGAVPVLQAKPASTFTGTFSDCSKAQKALIWEAIFKAKRWVHRALWRVWAVMGDISNAAKSKEIEDTHDWLKSQFHLGTGGKNENVFQEVVTIYRNLYKIHNAFGTTLPFECESSSSGDEYGYVYGGIWKTLIDRNIHFRPLFFDKTQMFEQMRYHGLIHEMAHKYAGIDGDVYEGRKEFPTLAPQKAIQNADSYASFCHYVNLFAP